MRPKWLCDYVWEIENQRDKELNDITQEYKKRIDEFILNWFDNSVVQGEKFVRNEKLNLYFEEIVDDTVVFSLDNCANIRFKPQELIGTLTKDGEVFLLHLLRKILENVLQIGLLM